jgi:hypothetical protein
MFLNLKELSKSLLLLRDLFMPERWWIKKKLNANQKSAFSKGLLVPLIGVVWAAAVYYILTIKYAVSDYGVTNKLCLAISCGLCILVYEVHFIWMVNDRRKNKNKDASYRINEHIYVLGLTLLVLFGLVLLAGLFFDMNENLFRHLIYKEDPTGLWLVIITAVINSLLFCIQRKCFYFKACRG